MRNQILMLLGILLAIAALAALIKPETEASLKSVDGICLGEQRTAVETRLGNRGTPVSYFETGNYTGWKTAKDRVFFGNHPPEGDKLEKPLVEGFAYGRLENSLLPLVGYNRQDQVEWVCGLILRGPQGALQGKSLAPILSEEFARQGYCMAGPCGWRYQDCQISVSNGGEGIGSGAADRWTVLLLTKGPLTARLQREQELQKAELEQLKRDMP